LIIIGLGNPGTKYEHTRHNVGFLAVEKAAERAGISLKKSFGKKYSSAEGRYAGSKAVFIEPLTYMNNSGTVIASLRRKFQLTPEDVVVVCDNLDLPPGVVRVKQGGGTAGHNGLASIVQYLGTKDFLRVYIGIGRPQFRGDVVKYVLGVPAAEERSDLNAGIDRAAEALVELLADSPEKVMNEFNRRSTPDSDTQ